MLSVLAMARFVLAAAAVVLVVWMVSVGLAPNAELGGVFALIGAVLAVPVLAYTVVTVKSVTAIARHHPRGTGLVVALSVVDVVVGLIIIGGLARSGAPTRSPLMVGFAPLALGVVTIFVAGRRTATQ